MSVRRLAAYTLAGASALAVVASLLVAGSPSQARLQRYDQQRVADLQAIESAVVTYASRQYRILSGSGFVADEALLPEDLSVLRQLPGYADLFLSDPITRQQYGYRPVKDGSYELCATFQAASIDQAPDSETSPTWSHGAGSTCFSRSIDPVQLGGEGAGYPQVAPRPVLLD